MKDLFQPSLTKKVPSEVLLDFMALKEQDETQANKAFFIFHDRYVKYVYKVCINTGSVRGITSDEALGKITNNSLLTAYMKSVGFKLPPDDPEELKEKKIKSWLASITRFSTMKYAKEENESRANNPIVYTGDYTFFEEIPDAEQGDMPPPSFERQAFEEAYSSLSEKERDIIETYFTYEDAQGKIPNEYLDGLCKRWNLLPDYPRKIKTRAIEKLILKSNQLLLQIQDKNGTETLTRRSSKVREETKKLLTFHRAIIPGDTGTG